MQKKRRSISEARAFRAAQMKQKIHSKMQYPTRHELGRIHYEGWKRQYFAQYGRCYNCSKPSHHRNRRLQANNQGQLVCKRCWWGRGNIFDPPKLASWARIPPACDLTCT